MVIIMTLVQRGFLIYLFQCYLVDFFEKINRLDDVDVWDIEGNTLDRLDMEYLFECWTRYPTGTEAQQMSEIF